MLALSTSWNAHRHTDGELLLREIQELGFQAFVIAPGMNPTLVAGMRRMISKGSMAVAALEGFFPTPSGHAAKRTSHCHLSARSPGDRRKAAKWTSQTIDYAADLGVSVVLLDLGPSPLHGLTPPLVKLANRNRLHSRPYVRIKHSVIDQRRRASRQILERVREGLEELLPQAQAKRVKLALTGQAALESVPSEEEIEQLLQDYRQSGLLVYWHDFGAAQVKENLGFLIHSQWIKTMRPHLAGASVHDVIWPDRLIGLPFGGMIAYREFLPLLPEGVPLVWRIPPNTPSPEILQAWLAWNEQRVLIS